MPTAVVSKRKLTPRSAARSASLRVNAQASPELVRVGHAAADDVGIGETQRRLDCEHSLSADQLEVASELAHQGCGSDSGVKFILARVEMQDPALQVVVVQIKFRAQFAQQPARIKTELDDFCDVGARATRPAFHEEVQAPAPLRRIESRPKQERRVVSGEPAQHLERRRRIGPRLGVRDRNLATIGKRGLGRSLRLAFYHAHVVAGLAQEPRRRRADDPGTEDHHVHCRRPSTQNVASRTLRFD